ncbi:MAG: ABC transporter ATP-binding protein [Clostridiaceae bacterium]|jgi:ABC-2 type transport system ATP-binding protein|nr:ABC transporter ATP-binding protein [Clostridiaceae bacterium]
MQAEVRVRNLVKRYKDLVAVDHLDLEIQKGEIYGLLGPNGSGKTTLINCILSLLRYEKGEVEIFGEPMKPTAYHLKQDIGVVSQEPAVYNELSVYENIDYFCGLYVSDKTTRRRLVEEVIEFVQLGEFRKFRPKKLSGGLLRRLNLACGIAHKPRLIFLDEPTVAVDPQSRNRILEGILQLRDEGSTIVYTTHYMEEVEFLCDRISIMDRGKVLITGTSDEIKAISRSGETVRVETFGLDETHLKTIETLPPVESLEYDQTELVLKMKAKTNGLLDILNYFEHHDIPMTRISSKQPTLNDVFLEITGKELRDDV